MIISENFDRFAGPPLWRTTFFGRSALVLAVTLTLVAALLPGGVAAAGEVERVSGPGRIETAVAISQEWFSPGVDAVFVARDDDFPDALAGGPLAALLGAPILLTHTGSLPQATADELQRLVPGRIYVLGGTLAVSEGVLAELGAFTDGPVTRLSGPDRFATAAAAAAEEAFAAPVPAVFVATGLNFPDALAGGVVAALEGAPILLVTTEDIPLATQQALEALQPGQIFVLGGTAVISDAVLEALAAYTTGEVTRVSGPDRVATAVEISKGWFTPETVEDVLIATAGNFPDSLAAVPAAFLLGAPLLLVGPSLTDVLEEELRRLEPRRIWVLGGQAAVSDEVAAALEEFLVEPEPEPTPTPTPTGTPTPDPTPTPTPTGTPTPDPTPTPTPTPTEPPPPDCDPVVLPDPADFASDDFDRNNLGAWMLVDPKDDGSLRMAGGNLELEVPGGATHNPDVTNNSLRVLRPIANEDFTIEAKFDSVPAERFQIQGIVVQESASNYMRFEFHHDGTNLRAYHEHVVEDGPAPVQENVIGADESLWLRVVREGDDWTLHYSVDDTDDWNAMTPLTAELEDMDAGLYVGNFRSPASATPGFTAVVDYVLLDGVPVEPDGGEDELAPYLYWSNLPPGPSSFIVDWRTDELASATVLYGDTADYGEEIRVEDFEYAHSLLIDDLEPDTTYHVAVCAEDAAGNLALWPLGTVDTGS